MKIKQTIISLIILATFGCIFTYQLSFTASADCAGVPTSVIECKGDKVTKDIEKTGLWDLLNQAVNILSAGVGVLAVGGIVYGSIRYASSGGNAEQTKKAKDIIFNVVLGLIGYGFMYAFLNWLIPGGLFP